MAGIDTTEPIYKVAVEKNLAMRTRDGLTLRADVYHPDAPGKFPVRVMRTPYDKSQQLALLERDYLAPRGYVVVVQDTRGRFASEGEFYPFIHEPADGYDTIEWAAALPWSNSKVATVGQSYLGLTQYLAGVLAPPHLQAMVPVSGPVTYFESCVWRRGVFELAWMLSYFNFMARNKLDRDGVLTEYQPIFDSWLRDPAIPLSALSDEAFRHVPVLDWAERLKPGAPYFADYLRNWTDGPYWQATDPRPLCRNVTVPMMHVGSWYDAFQYDTLAMFTQLRRDAATERARCGQRLIMGPWGHLLPYAVPTSRGAGDIDFGPEAKVELLIEQERWLRAILDGRDEEASAGPPVRIFVMGENRWRDENEWPLARTRYTNLWLSGSGHANSLRGDGMLGYEAPGDEPADGYVYDPNDPVPTRGGTVLGLPPGVYDQREIENRDDVLVYTSAPLASDTEVTGPISLRLHAASSAPDTDFVAKLVDVRSDGYAHNIAEGVVRARFRESLTAPSPIVPGKIYEYSIDMWSTSHVFKAGHRFRLEVTSSNFPRWDRNPNSGHPFGVDREFTTARQTIFHDRAHQSHLILPIIPR
ncbi:MAG TPA: CocE/NonD family hydrolase [Candidatus Binataceae bacterium]|nr:CocE/NonD family hydrolase [Candidatus Binataceae bacterium]